MMVTQKSTSAELFERLASGVHCRELAVAVIRYCPSCRWAVQCTRYSSPGPSAGTETCPSASGKVQGDKNIVCDELSGLKDAGALQPNPRIDAPAVVSSQCVTTAVYLLTV